MQELLETALLYVLLPVVGLVVAVVSYLYITRDIIGPLRERSWSSHRRSSHEDDAGLRSSRGSSTPSQYGYAPLGQPSTVAWEQQGVARAVGQEVNADALTSTDHSGVRGTDQRSQLGYAKRSESSPSRASLGAGDGVPSGRADGWSERSRDEAISRMQRQMDHIDRMVSEILQIVRESDKERTPPPNVSRRVSQPVVYAPTTIKEIVQFWNEKADWTNPEVSLESYRHQIHRDGWRISDTIKTHFRVVYQVDNPSKLFLFPYLKKAKKHYPTDFFVTIGTADSKELDRPATVQLFQPDAKIDHEIDRVLRGDAPLYDVFKVVSKGEII